MSASLDKSKDPGVYIPPPLFYVATFIAAICIQKKIHTPDDFFHTTAIKIIGVFFLIAAVFFIFRSIRQFFLTKNTVILIKPATSLQTTGVYTITRNPMYLGLAILYLAIACFIGNYWHVILLPLLLLIVQEYIIKREEKYLSLEFGDEFENYKHQVRRWL